MKTIASGDWHLTDNPRDEYRWGIFDWLGEQVDKYKPYNISLLGDVTDSKDRHSEALVNRLIDALSKLAQKCEIIWCPGNHDGIQEGRPFFRFASHIKGLVVANKPQATDRCLYIPNTRDHETAWADLTIKTFNHYEYIFCHQTFDGCYAENGQVMRGIPPSWFKGFKGKIFSGDIHVPQVVSKNPYIEYVGAPYRIRFGDSFTPRLLLISNKGGEHFQKDLYYPTINKHLLEIEGDEILATLSKRLRKLGANEGDQIKVRVSLPRASYADWPKLKVAIKEKVAGEGLALFGPELSSLRTLAHEPGTQEPARAARQGASPREALAAYAAREGLSGAVLKAGTTMLARAEKSPGKGG